MYKVEYTKLGDVGGKPGNISQGDDIAYMDCDLDDIRKDLAACLRANEKLYYPVINSVTRIKGHIVRWNALRRSIFGKKRMTP